MHENPEWEKARQALANISKANAAAASGNSKVHSTARRIPAATAAVLPVVSTIKVSTLIMVLLGNMVSQALIPQHPNSHQFLGNTKGPPVPGMEDGGMSYSSQPQQMQIPNPLQSPMQHPNHPLQHSNLPMGPRGQQQQGGPPGGLHSQPNQSSASYNQQQHSYQEAAKPKKGQQLWNRMKQAPGKPEDWPQDMKEYVQRCFTACESEEDKDRTEKLLKEVLQGRRHDGTAYTIDWSREPLPGLGRDNLAESPKKKHQCWEVSSRHSPCASMQPSLAQQQQRSGGGNSQPQRGGGNGGTGTDRTHGDAFPTKFGNCNVFMKENSSSSSVDSCSTSRSSSRSPSCHFQRSYSDSDSSYSGNECRLGGRRNAQKNHGHGGHMDRGQMKTQRRKRQVAWGKGLQCDC
ncbi:hypothetical protein E2320_022710 [Naja naja]|nr:hypothetical protein E2320_022710 [Naja naja]